MNQNAKAFLLHMCSSNDAALRHYHIPSNDYYRSRNFKNGLKWPLFAALLYVRANKACEG